ncbi:MAG: glycosyltransferase family 9 protein [Lentisphaeria bacterium]|jgi:heptosyltransferase-2
MGAGRPAQAPAIVYRNGALGDFLLTLPLLRELLRRGDPVILLSRPAYRPLLPPELATAITFRDADSAAGTALFAESATLPETWRGGRFLAFLAADPTLAANLARHGITPTWIPPRPTGPEPAAASFLRAAGLPVPADLLRTPQLASWGKPAAAGRNREAAALWLHPGSGSPRKNAAPAWFAEVARRWRLRTAGAPVVVSFGEADAAVRGPVLAALAAAGVAAEVVEGLALAELAAALRRRARRFVGNDSGVSHLAAALGIPVLARFVATEPRVWRPLGRCHCL